MDVSEVKCYNQLKWIIILIQKVEILKMASNMAVNKASKTYMTDILDKNNLILTLNGCLEAKLYNQSNKNMFSIQKVEIQRWHPRWPSVRFLRPT